MDKKKVLRIAMIGHKRIPSREGGVEIVVEELSTRMAAQGHNVTCYNRSGHHVSGKDFDQEHLKEYKGVRLKRVLTINAKGLAAMSSSVFGAIRIAFGKYDVAHFHAEGPCFMLWLPKLFGKKCIATIHGLDHQRAKWGRFARWYIMQGEKCAVKYADEIIVLSKNVQAYFEKLYGRDTLFIPNGVNEAENKMPKLITETYGLRKDDYILFLGRIVPEKGLRYLIEAFANVKTDKKLVIAGGSSDTADFVDEIRQLAKEDDRIIFTGFVQGNMLQELYSNAYIYTLPSDLEGMPLSLLEAMSYGNCCLTSDIAECTEVAGEYALSFKAGNVQELSQKIQLLCDDTELTQRYKKQAADYICEKYNWDNVVDSTIKIYNGEK